MSQDNANDRVRLSVYTATNGSWRLVLSRVEAHEIIKEWQQPVGELLVIKGRLTDVDLNRIECCLKKQIVTAIDIIEINQEF